MSGSGDEDEQSTGRKRPKKKRRVEAGEQPSMNNDADLDGGQVLGASINPDHRGSGGCTPAPQTDHPISSTSDRPCKLDGDPKVRSKMPPTRPEAHDLFLEYDTFLPVSHGLIQTMPLLEPERAPPTRLQPTLFPSSDSGQSSSQQLVPPFQDLNNGPTVLNSSQAHAMPRPFISPSYTAPFSIPSSSSVVDLQLGEPDRPISNTTLVEHFPYGGLSNGIGTVDIMHHPNPAVQDPPSIYNSTIIGRGTGAIGSEDGRANVVTQGIVQPKDALTLVTQ